MLSTAPNMPSLVRASHARALASRALAPTGVALLRGRQSQQVRSLWFNIFPSYIDPDASRDYKARRNLLRSRYRYMKSLNRQLSWDNPGRSHDEARERFDKYFMETVGKTRHWSPVRCSRTTGGPKMEPKNSSAKSPWILELGNISRYLDEQRDALASMIKPSSKTTTTQGNPAESSKTDYVIDPITNRKVPKHPSPAADARNAKDADVWEERRARIATLFKGLEVNPQTQAFHSHGAPPADELDKYRDVTIDKPTYNEELIHRVTDLPKKSPQGVPPEPPQPASKVPEPPAEIMDELDEYRKVDINYPPSMNEELIHRVGDLPSKEDPNSVPAAAEKERAFSVGIDGVPEYEDLDKYKPFMDREEALDPKSDEVQARSWPSRVRHLEPNMGTQSTSKATESIPSWSPPTPRSLPSKYLFGGSQTFQTEPAMFDYDPYSKEPTGLELSWDKECASDPKANKMFIKHYSTDRTASDPVIVEPSAPAEASAEPTPAPTPEPEPESVEPPKVEAEASRDMHNSCQDMYGSTDYTLEKELRANQLAREEQTPANASEEAAPRASGETGEPTLYKILAYDPTMQKIDVAETTSEVQDVSTPLSPAEVMLRLSNPSKFFPHFGPLQKEGFEIVSGSGDVLVFRKVRSTVDTSPTPTVNPIDMMGRVAVPNLGNFASPTGFVNYDYPIEDEEVTSRSSDASKGSSTSDSTESSSDQNTKPRRGGIVKRTATGAAWLAGTAYGVGVVSEFAKKGGKTAQNTAKHL